MALHKFSNRRETLLTAKIGPFDLNKVTEGDCRALIPQLPDESIDMLVTSPPYWGQRVSKGTGSEEDPRKYLTFLAEIFSSFFPKLKKYGVVWINLGDAYNTPVNWRLDDRKYSSLGPDKIGLPDTNTAYTKPRAKRKAFIDEHAAWLTYGNLLALPNRLVISLCDQGFLYRGEVIWRKKNAMPEGRCRRPHRQHEPIYLLARDERHLFRVTPPVGSVWEFPNEKISGPTHFLASRRNCLAVASRHMARQDQMWWFSIHSQVQEQPAWLLWHWTVPTSDLRSTKSK